MRYRHRVPFVMKLPSHLAISRYGIYYLRIERNGVEKRRSLRTRDPSEALAAAYKFGATIYGMTTKSRFGYTLETPTIKIKTDGSAEDHSRAMEALSSIPQLSEAELLNIRMQGERELAQIYAEAAEWRRQQEQASAQVKPEPARLQTLQAALDDYLAEKSNEWREGTLVTYKSIFNRFILEFGATTFISSVTAEQFIRYRKPLELITHPDTIDRDCGALKGWFEWAIKRQRYLGPNPIERPSPSASIRDNLVEEFEIPRNPFDAHDLKKIFEVLSDLKNPADYWLPILGLYTGARIGELCSAELNGIDQYEKGKWSMYLFGKTPSSKRQIPLHPNLIESGFLVYLDDVKKSWPSADRIFPHLTKDKKMALLTSQVTHLLHLNKA